MFGLEKEKLFTSIVRSDAVHISKTVALTSLYFGYEF